MKTLKIFLLVLALGIGSSFSGGKNYPEKYYSGSMKAGILTILTKSTNLVLIGVEGSYEYYFQYVKFDLDYLKFSENQDLKNERVSPSCSWLPWI